MLTKKGLTATIITLLISVSAAISQPKNGGNYFIESALGGKVLDVKWGNSAAGTPLQIWEFNGTTAQKFKLENAGGDYFYIKSFVGRYVHVSDIKGTIKTIVTLSDKKSTDNFKWKFKPARNNLYYIVSKTGTFLDVQWAGTKNGTPVWLWTHSGTSAQKWRLKRIGNSQESIGNLQVNMPPPQPSPNRPGGISSGTWQSAFDAALESLEIRINNFTSSDFAQTNNNTYRWVKPKDCSYKIKAGNKSVSQTFDLEPFRYDPMTIYIHDLKLDKARTSYEDNRVKIILEFEESGMEVRTNCIDNWGCGGIGNPNFNLVDPVMEVLFTPIAKNGKISYKDPEIRIFGHLSHIGANLTISYVQGIFDMMNFDHNNKLRQGAADYFRAYFDRSDVKDSISEVLNYALSHAYEFNIDIPGHISEISIQPNGSLFISGQ